MVNQQLQSKLLQQVNHRYKAKTKKHKIEIESRNRKYKQEMKKILNRKYKTEIDT